MKPATHALHAELIRHAKGIVVAFEEWLGKADEEEIREVLRLIADWGNWLQQQRIDNQHN